MKIALSIVPVILFLFFLYMMDSFKLVVKKQVVQGIVWGCVCALISYLINTFLLDTTGGAFSTLSLYLAPGVEEMLKSLFIFYLIRKKRIGFMIDAAIYGFAAGTGFALVENLFYVYSLTETSMLTWIVRGFGTAVMHGGCTALFAVIYIGAKARGRKERLMAIFALVLAYLIHSVFNHFYINPVIQTVVILLFLPLIFVLIFRYNENRLQNWMELELSSEVELLKMIRQGRFSSTRTGQYLASLRQRFPGEMILDMYCYLQLYLELSLKAKRNIMLRENGFSLSREEGIGEKLTELGILHKRIGKVGELTLSPLIRMSYRDVWKLNLLK